MKRVHYAWWILIGCCALQLGVVGIAASCAGIFLVPVSTALSVEVSRLSLYMTIQNITMMLLYPKAGKLLNRYDIRVSVSIPTLGVCLGFILLSRATSVYMFYAVALLLGTCYSFLMFLTIPLLINNWFQKKTGFALGIALSLSGIGGSVFSIIIGSIIENFSWRAGYLTIAACVAVLVLPFSLFVLRLRPSDKGLLPYGAEDTPAQGTSGQSAATTATASNIQFTGTSPFGYLLVFGGMMGLLAAMQPNITVFASSLGCATTTSSMMSSIIMASALIAKLVLGAANDKLGIRKTIFAAMIPAAVAIVLFFLASDTRIYFLVLGAALYGIMIAFTTVQPPILVRSIFGQQNYSQVYPRIQQGYSLMSAIALPLYTSIYDACGSYRPVIVLLMAALILAIVCSMLSQRSVKHN